MQEVVPGKTTAITQLISPIHLGCMERDEGCAFERPSDKQMKPAHSLRPERVVSE